MGKSRVALFAIAMSFLGAAAGAAENADAIKALFKQYSPDAYYLLDAYSKKAKDYGLKDIAAYMDASSEDSRWRSYARIVHECAIHTMDLYRNESSTMIVLSRDKNYQVPWTGVYYSSIVASEIPERLRMPHYSLLVDQPSDLPLGHWAGVYGLMDEMAAHYLAMKATWELLPLLQGQGAKAPWGSFFQSINESLAGILEFKYYAMKYVLYEERDSPEIYRGIMENKVFAKAFIDLNGTCDAFIKRYFAAKDDLYESIRSAGLTIKEQGSVLVVGPKGAEARKELSSATYAALANELSKSAYRDLSSKLNGGVAVASTPPFPGMELVATGSAPPIKAVLSEAEALKLGGLNIGSGKRGAVIATQQLRALRMGLGTPQSGTAASAASAAATGPGKTGTGSSSAGSGAVSGAVAVKAVVDDMRNGKASGSALLALKKKGNAGDVKVKAVDIVGADLRVFPDMLVCGITFADPAGKVTLNKAEVAGKANEYECSVVIDLDGNGQNLYSLSLTWYKEPKASPFEAFPAEDCNTELWNETPTGYSKLRANLTASWSSPFLVFVLRDGKDLPLKKITDRSRFKVEAYYDDGQEGMEDVLDL